MFYKNGQSDTLTFHPKSDIFQLCEQQFSSKEKQ